MAAAARRARGCEEANSRSLWFGVVPTYSAEHWIGRTRRQPVLPKLDDHEIYELVCFVPQPPPSRATSTARRGSRSSKPTRPFRLAAPFDPDGTKNHTVTITAPDLRRLAARAGQQLGPGGARIVTPPGSGARPGRLHEDPGAAEPGRSVRATASASSPSSCSSSWRCSCSCSSCRSSCLLFQLWWMLALRFCIPPSLSFTVVAKYFADAKLLIDLPAAANAKASSAFDEVMGVNNAALEMLKRSALLLPTEFEEDKAMAGNLVAAMDARNVSPTSDMPKHEIAPSDPLCPEP